MINDTLMVDITIGNKGDVAGKEVVQIYVSRPNSTIDRPVQELKAFAKTPNLQPGQEVNLTFKIPVSELSYWDERASKWALEKGEYNVQANSSSRDNRLIENIIIE